MFTISGLTDLFSFLDRNTPDGAPLSRFRVRTSHGAYCGEFVDTHWHSRTIGLRVYTSTTNSHAHVVYIAASAVQAVNIIGQEGQA